MTRLGDTVEACPTCGHAHEVGTRCPAFGCITCWGDPCFEGHNYQPRHEEIEKELVPLQVYLGDRCTKCGKWLER